MKRILIVGGGFAGLSAARRLGRLRGRVEVVLFDPRPASEFLPLLPDVAGGRIGGERLRYSLQAAARRFGFRFVQAEVSKIDLANRRVGGGFDEEAGDGLLIACGSHTDFYGNRELAARALTLDCVADGERIAAAVRDGGWQTFLVCGGGYTGIEIATHLKNRLRHAQDRRQVVLVEREERVLKGLPESLRRYAEDNLQRCGIEVRCGRTVEELAEEAVVLDNGERLPKTLLIWSAGVRTPQLLDGLPGERVGQSRLPVDQNLRFAPGCFAAGDAAGFQWQGRPLRMGIQFSLKQGARAADNLWRELDNRAARPFRPFDPGYIVPMANHRSCGRVLGVRTRGRPATFLHYFMCLYRTWGLRNRLGATRDLLLPGRSEP